MRRRIYTYEEAINRYEKHIYMAVKKNIRETSDGKQKLNKKIYGSNASNVIYGIFIFSLAIFAFVLGIWALLSTNIEIGLIIIALAAILVMPVIWQLFISKKNRKKAKLYAKYKSLERDDCFYEQFKKIFPSKSLRHIEDASKSRREAEEDDTMLKGFVWGGVVWISFISFFYEQNIKEFISLMELNNLLFIVYMFVALIALGMLFYVERQFTKTNVEKQRLTLLINDFENFRILNSTKKNDTKNKRQ